MELLDKVKATISESGWTWNNSKSAWIKNRTAKTSKELYVDLFSINEQYLDYSPAKLMQVIEDICKDKVESSALDFEEIASIGVTQSIFSVGNKDITLELRGFTDVPNKIDFKLMEKVAFAVDSNDRIVFFYLSQHESNCTQYTMINSKDMDVDVESAMLRSGTYLETQTWWEQQLLEWERNIVAEWNMNVRNPTFKVQDYILANLPITLITACKIIIIGTEKETGAMVDGEAEKIVIARGVKFEIMGNRVQYSDFVAANIKKYKSAAIKELAQMPKIYGNAGEDAMSIFDVKKYIVKNPPELSVYWQEVKSKYTEDEWAVLSAWVVAMLDSKNSGRQSLAQIDYDGYSGKSVLSDVLTKLLSLKNVAAIGKGSLSDKFWAAKLWNKRLVIVDDNKNSRLLQTEAVHCVLGAGYADIEYKGEVSFSWKMSSKLLINSNIDLEINSSMLHERSRVIILHPKMPKELVDKLSAKDDNGEVILDQNGNPKLIGDSNFAQHLVDTIDGFLCQATKYYRKLCPNRADIIIPNSVLERIYETETSEETIYTALLNKAFVLTGEILDTMTQSEFFEQYMYVAKSNKIYNSMATNQEFGNFKQFIKKVHKVEAKGRERLYRGITKSDYKGLDPNHPESQFVRDNQPVKKAHSLADIPGYNYNTPDVNIDEID